MSESKKIGVTEVVLRDAHQSLLATRFRYHDMEAALKNLDDVGFWSVESWGGAIFDSCIRSVSYTHLTLPTIYSV